MGKINTTASGPHDSTHKLKCFGLQIIIIFEMHVMSIKQSNVCGILMHHLKS